MSMKQVTGSLLAATASCLVWGVSSAQAADLGGNCCADLEERIAELESTTARKGNRKVSLTISGWVNEAVFFWDDGHGDSDAYVGTNKLEESRIKLSGEAKINNDWSAGYTIELGINGAASSAFSETNTGAANSLSTRKSNWFVKSKSFGKLTVGQEGTATYHLLDDADGVNTRNYSDAEAAAVYMGSFEYATGKTWKSLFGGFNNGTPGQSGRRNVVRYDTPTFAGFTATAAWGEDDVWDMKLSYKGEVGDFKLLGQVGYGESNDPGRDSAGKAISGAGTNTCKLDANDDVECSWWGAAGTIMHAPTGLFVYGGYGEFTDDNQLASADTASTWFVQAGIERKFIPLGKTTIFGEYRNDDIEFTGSDLDFYAAGVVQNIEAAAMDLYVMYRHAEGETTKDDFGSLPEFDMVITGARIQF